MSGAEEERKGEIGGEVDCGEDCKNKRAAEQLIKENTPAQPGDYPDDAVKQVGKRHWEVGRKQHLQDCLQVCPGSESDSALKQEKCAHAGEGGT